MSHDSDAGFLGPIACTTQVDLRARCQGWADILTRLDDPVAVHQARQAPQPPTE